MLGIRAKALVWPLLLGLTFTILTHPINFQLVPGPVESVGVIANLPRFAGLYYAWLLVLLALLFSCANPAAYHWQKVVLTALFAVVFWGFWVINSPEGQFEELLFLAHARFVEAYGRMSLSEPNLVYFSFPGIAILAHVLSSVPGLSHLAARTVLLLFNAVFMAIILYRLYRPLTPSKAGCDTLYLLGFLLVVQGSMTLTGGFFFRPEAALAHPLLLVLVLLVSLNKDGRSLFTSGRGSLMAIIVFAALVVTHYFTSLALVAILGGIYAGRATSRIRPGGFSTVFLFLAIIAAWQLWYSPPLLERQVTYVSRLLDLFLQGKGFFYVNTLFAANAGGSVPLWASATRLFWLVGIYVLGGMLAVVNLRRLRSLTQDERDWTSALIAIAAVTVVMTLATGTGDQLARYLQWGTFFAVPLVLLRASRARRQGLALTLVLVPFTLLSFPSFLAFHGSESVKRFYPQERRTAALLTRLYAEASGRVSVFGGVRATTYYVYALPEAEFHASIDPVSARGEVPVVWRSIEGLVAQFVSRDSSTHPPAVFVYDEALPLTYGHLLGISPEDPGWRLVEAKLATTDVFYHSGMVQLYLPSSGRP